LDEQSPEWTVRRRLQAKLSILSIFICRAWRMARFCAVPTRTRDFSEEFGRVLAHADRVFVTEIYPARETDSLGVSSGSIGELMTRNVSVYSSPESAAEALIEMLSGDEVVLFTGAGDIWKGSRALAEGANVRIESNG
jgi:UDP-N-acetylmuramate-alanine ligase